MKNTILLLSLFYVIMLSSCSDQTANRNQIPNDANIIEAKAGERFVIKLESNITTGYSWHLAKSDSDIIELVSNEYKPYQNTGNIVGSGGIEEWTFKAISKGKTSITLEYVRPWEKDIPPVKQQTYSITIK